MQLCFRQKNGPNIDRPDRFFSQSRDLLFRADFYYAKLYEVSELKTNFFSIFMRANTVLYSKMLNSRNGFQTVYPKMP